MISLPLLLFSCTKDFKDQIVIIPENFRGWLAIQSNVDKSGVARIKREFIYDFSICDSTRIIQTSSKTNIGFVNCGSPRTMMIGEERKYIPTLFAGCHTNHSLLDSSTICAYWIGSFGTMEGVFSGIYVGTLEEINNVSFEMFVPWVTSQLSIEESVRTINDIKVCSSLKRL